MLHMHVQQAWLVPRHLLPKLLMALECLGLMPMEFLGFWPRNACARPNSQAIPGAACITRQPGCATMTEGAQTTRGRHNVRLSRTPASQHKLAHQDQSWGLPKRKLP